MLTSADKEERLNTGDSCTIRARAATLSEDVPLFAIVNIHFVSDFLLSDKTVEEKISIEWSELREN